MLKKALLFILLSMAGAVHAANVISVNAGPVNGNAAGSFNAVFSFTSGPSPNGVLLVAFAAGAPTGSTFNDINFVTWGGTALTQKLHTHALDSSGSGVQNSEIWYLVAPAINTTQNITVNFSLANSSRVYAIEYADVNTSAPFGVTSTVASNTCPTCSPPGSGSLTTTVSTSLFNSLFFVFGSEYGPGGPLSADPAFTSRWNFNPANQPQFAADFYSAAPVSKSAATYYGSFWQVAIQQMLELDSVQPTPTITVTSTITGTNTPTSTITTTRTVTPTMTPTSTITTTRTVTPSSTATPTTTPTATPTATLTAVCTYVGQQTALPTPGAMWSLCVMKPLTLTSPNRICAVQVSVASGAGKWWAALYSVSNTAHLVATSGIVASSGTGFQSVPINSRVLPAGKYAVAVEMSDTLKLGAAASGPDSYFTTQWGSFPPLPNPVVSYQDHSINAYFCSY